jgi:VanZ family protein
MEKEKDKKKNPITEKVIKVVDKLRRILFLFVTTNFQKKVPLDKQRHVTVCFYGVVGLSPMLMFLFPVWLAIIVAVTVVFLGSVAYEFYQKYSGNGVFEVKDILANAAGSVIGGLVTGLGTFILLEIFS